MPLDVLPNFLGHCFCFSVLDAQANVAVSTDVDKRYYDHLIGSVPPESHSVPLILHCLLEQVCTCRHHPLALILISRIHYTHLMLSEYLTIIPHEHVRYEVIKKWPTSGKHELIMITSYKFICQIFPHVCDWSRHVTWCSQTREYQMLLFSKFAWCQIYGHNIIVIRHPYIKKYRSCAIKVAWQDPSEIVQSAA